MGGPPWQTDPMTLEEEASVGYQHEESEACEPEKLVEEETAQLEWWKTSEWDHVDECLWAAIGGIIGEFEDRMGIHEADWVTTIRLNGSLLDSIVEEIAQYVVDYYTSPLDAHFLPEYEDSPEFQELERVLDEEISFDEGYKRLFESDFVGRLAHALNPGQFRETVEPVEGKQRWWRRNPALN